MKKLKVVGTEKIKLLDNFEELFIISNNNVRPDVIDIYDFTDKKKLTKVVEELRKIEHIFFQTRTTFDANSTSNNGRIKISIQFTESLLVETDRDNFTVISVYYNKSITNMDLFEQVVKILKKGINTKKELATGNINLLLRNIDGFHTKQFQVVTDKIDIDTNYNDDFKEIHDIIISRLNTNEDKGIVLLHGAPGTGKTSFLRYLTSKIKKDILYLPPDMTTQLSSPDLIPFLLSYPNSILFVEDGENVIAARKGQENQSVSNLLNLGDGLLSDCLKMQIVCTFNCDISKVDEALLRKGRLIAKYEFKALSVEKSNKLLKKLNVDFTVAEEKKLCDLYNMNEKSMVENKPKIGFQRQNNNVKMIEK
jgi:hypothetical protein